MGSKTFYMDGKLTFDWADSVSHPAIVSTIDWDSGTSAYTSCNPSCTVVLQRSDAATLDTNTSAVILLQTTHSSSNGNRYFVMEHRLGGFLLVHWADMHPTKGRTGTYGNTVLTDCNPETITWDDAMCSPGQYIELDTGDTDESIKVSVYVHPYSALGGGKLKVTLGTGGEAVPPPQPTATFDFNSTTSPGWSTGGGDPPFAFTKKEGRTPSGGTGPSAGVGGSGSYFYAEASGPRVQGDLFTLTYDGSACSDIGFDVSSVAFHYHMYGSTWASFV